MAKKKTKALPLTVWGWNSFRQEANGSHHQTREIVAAPSKAAAARAAEVKDPRKLDNLCATGNAVEIHLAMAHPGVVFWASISGPRASHHGNALYTEAGKQPLTVSESAANVLPVSSPSLAIVAPTAEPLPCPCCGGKAEVCLGEHDFVDAKVRCTKCGLESGLEDETKDATKNRLRAVAGWNRRQPIPGAAKAILAAAVFIEDEAQCLKDSSSNSGGQWVHPADQAAHDTMLQLAAGLREILPHPTRAGR